MDDQLEMPACVEQSRALNRQDAKDAKRDSVQKPLAILASWRFNHRMQFSHFSPLDR
jgi:hypothetical protein